jgi:pimeloyl-ACP methyl ester carboxylesterase
VVTTERVLGTDLRWERAGTGPPLLYLHGEDGFLFARPLLDELARHFTVIAPLHPAWHGPCPRHIRVLDDLSYLYLELLDHLDISCPVVGSSIGGWIAAEMATKTEARISSLVLVAPLGIKTGDREHRTFVDIYATRASDLRSALYADAAKAPDLTAFDDDQFLALATAQEAVTRFGWEPYLHNPQLPARLARIRRPTLVVNGDSDRFVLDPDYYSTFSGLIGDNARLVTLPGVGHRVDEEAPARLGELIADFVHNLPSEPTQAVTHV